MSSATAPSSDSFRPRDAGFVQLHVRSADLSGTAQSTIHSGALCRTLRALRSQCVRTVQLSHDGARHGNRCVFPSAARAMVMARWCLRLQAAPSSIAMLQPTPALLLCVCR
jgi:hypothetical protein